MRNYATRLIACAALAGCMQADGTSTGGAGLTVEQQVARAFPNPADRQSIFMALPSSDLQPSRSLRIGFYTDEITDAAVLQRMQAYCTRSGYGAASVNRIRGGSNIIQDDGSLKASRNGVFVCA